MTNESKEVIYKGRKFWNVAKLVRHKILTLESTGSSPVIPAKNKKRERKPVYYKQARPARGGLLTLESVGSSPTIPVTL